ncbi:MAG: hypothetical protein MSA56_05295 [Clostridium sp.]|nr:hypothetical protein [Clostridium sp.]
MIPNSERIQSMLNNILEQVNIIKNDFNYNGGTHYDYIIEKLEKAQWDLNVMLKIAYDEKERHWRINEM